MPGFCLSPSLSACSNSCPLSQWCHPTISSSVIPFSSCLQSFPASESFHNKSALWIRWPEYWSFSVSPSNEYSDLISFRIGWFGLCCLQGSQESSLAPQFKSINSLVFSLLYGPTLTSIFEYWRNHSFDYMDLCWQSNVSPFYFIYLFWIYIYFIYFNWRLITLQYCGGFCHTLTGISHGCSCVPHPEPPPTSLPMPSLRVIPVHQPWAPCLMHQTWTGDLFHIWKYTCFSAILSNHPTLAFSHRVQKSVLYICVSFAVSLKF